MVNSEGEHVPVFDPEFVGRFKLFTLSHLMTIALFVVLWILIPLIFRGRNSARADRVFRISLSVILVMQYLGWMLWEVMVGRFTWALSLPLNLCDFTNFLCAIVLINKNHRLFEIVYYWALAGAIQSFITPNVYFGFPHLEFVVFYLQHGGEILAILYLIFVSGYRTRPISIAKSFGALVVYVLAVYLFNLVTDSNYMFLMADTPHPSTVTKMIGLFGDPPRHMIGLGIVALFSMLILYVPFYVKDLIQKSREKQG
jgi:hypothetical integral membrane protein (TIGR02206 family)